MQLMYFTEQPMSAYPAEEGLELGATALMFPNKFFDPVAGILGVWGNDGTVTHEDAKTCIRPLGQELFPEVLKMATNSTSRARSRPISRSASTT